MSRDISRLTTQALENLLGETNDEEVMDEIYDELERRQRDEDLRDHTEEDYYAAQSERLEMWYNEY